MSAPVPISATNWLNLFESFFAIGLVAGGAVIGMMVYFIAKYRHIEGRKEVVPEPTPIKTRYREAIILATISSIILFSIATYSLDKTNYIQYPPSSPDSVTIQVTAFQWDFKFKYPNNVTTVGTVRVPAGRPVIFRVTSSDVMHNFGIPDYRLKIDAIPGAINTLWVMPPDVQGNSTIQYPIICYELCGDGHTFMRANMVVMSQHAFDTWLNQTSAMGMG